MKRAVGMLLVGFVTLAGIAAVGRVAAPRLSTVETSCPGGKTPSSDVLMCEDFEDPAFDDRWNIGSHFETWPAAQFVLCSNGNFGFKSGCAAWSNQLIFDNAWGFWGYDARRAFPPQPEFYVRWYQYISDPYVWGALEDKAVMVHDSADTITTYVATSRNQLPVEQNSGPGVPFVANYQDFDWPETGGQYTRVNRFQNQGSNITLQPGTWYLFEWYLKLNTPGVSDGVTKLWIDDASQSIAAQTLRLHHSDMRWLRTRDAGRQFSVLRLTVYHNGCDRPVNTCPPNGPSTLNQSHRWDQIVISKTPIGPMQQPPIPGVPTRLRIIG
jgi:hypothetical protein